MVKGDPMRARPIVIVARPILDLVGGGIRRAPGDPDGININRIVEPQQQPLLMRPPILEKGGVEIGIGFPEARLVAVGQP